MQTPRRAPDPGPRQIQEADWSPNARHYTNGCPSKNGTKKEIPALSAGAISISEVTPWYELDNDFSHQE